MNKLKVLILVLVGSFLFTGCVTMGEPVGPVKTDAKTNMKYDLVKTPNNDYVIMPRDLSYANVLWRKDNKTKKAAQVKRKNLYALLRAVALETKRMGYNYFVLTNPEVNGFSGFPIHNFEQFMKYVTLEDRKPTFDTLSEKTSAHHYTSLIASHGQLYVRFLPVSKKVYDSGLFAVWKVSDFI